jgi:glycosyltransferase involved in cell wall biosynthesis
MRFLLACKRHYTNKDLLLDRFGRLYHLPVQLGTHAHEGLVIAADYRNEQALTVTEPGVTFESEPLRVWRLPAFTWRLWRRAKRFQPDVMLASGDTHFGVMAALIARRLKIPLVFDVYDNYEVFASARIPGMRSAFRWVLKSADLVVCAGDPLRELVEQHTSATLVIANGVDTSVFTPGDRDAARRRLGLPETGTIIGYFGSIADRRGVEVLIAAAVRLRDEGRPVTLLRPGTRADAHRRGRRSRDPIPARSAGRRFQRQQTPGVFGVRCRHRDHPSF